LAEPDESASGGTSFRDLWQDSRARPTALIAVAALVGLVIWLIVESVGDDGSTSSTTPTQTSGPVALSASGLATLVQAAGQTVYWVGERPGVQYELSQNDTQTYVRYLPTGVAAGDERQLLTIGTYPVDNAYDVTAGTREQGAEVIDIPGGGVAAVSAKQPTSVYVAFPDVDYQIEVYDPDPAVARKLATSGAVQVVPAPEAVAQARGPERATVPDLRALAKSLGHPLYWAGPRAGTTYELKVNEDGAVYIRYLPPGKDVGSNDGVLTVVTYPVTNGFEVTKGGGKVKGTVTKDLAGGAVAIYASDNPHNVYVGFPGEDVQVEVYSPSPAQAPSLVTRGKIVPVG
jgi:hypothetical protein